MPTVRTTMQPHVELDVSDVEYLDLKRQGVLINEEPAATPAAAPAKTPAVAKSKE